MTKEKELSALAGNAPTPLDRIDRWRTPVSVNPALQQLASSERVLLLQGPVGPFFDRLTRWLQTNGTEVRRVVFQGGDEFDCRALAPIRFQRPPAEWPSTFGELLSSWRPDCIVLFGQSRYYHKVALERARALDVPVVVMEEGYFRPGFVTMELGGVNGYSTTLDRFDWAPANGGDVPQPDLCQRHFQKMAWHASQHYLALDNNHSHYPHYQHHRSTNLGGYARHWLTSWARKYGHLRADLQFQRQLFACGQPYFFVPLQLEGDSQISQHSPFRNIAEFVLQILHSFAAHAPHGAWLVFRQHPHARGGDGHIGLIREVAAALGIEALVHHMVEGDTPDLAENSAGTVVINSTVGLQALERGSSLIALGDTFYRRQGLTMMSGLDQFWAKPEIPDAALARKFLSEVKGLTQASASVYALADQELHWPS